MWNIFCGYLSLSKGETEIRVSKTSSYAIRLFSPFFSNYYALFYNVYYFQCLFLGNNSRMFAAMDDV